MRNCALTVEHMAWVYGGLINRILIEGIRDCGEDYGNNDMESCFQLSKPKSLSSSNSSVCSLLLTDVSVDEQVHNILMHTKSD
jgi:hypothetical protein